MSQIDNLHSNGNEFDPFLFANVGEDRNGTDVTVVSALARLGFAPWKEAARLAALDPKAARDRLGAILEGFMDVPALDGEHATIAAELVMKLPKRLSQGATKKAASSASRRPLISVGWFLVVVVVAIGLARIYFVAQSG